MPWLKVTVGKINVYPVKTIGNICTGEHEGGEIVTLQCFFNRNGEMIRGKPAFSNEQLQSGKDWFGGYEALCGPEA